LSLILLRAGRDALGVDEAPAGGVCKSPADAKSPEAIQQDKSDSSAPRSGGKQALIVSILSSPSGATLAELMAATGLVGAYDARRADRAAPTWTCARADAAIRSSYELADRRSAD
jgi:hypothetical protein